MDFYEINTLGKMWLERITSPPAWNGTFEGRIVYATGDEMLYFADSTKWVTASIPSGTRTLFYQDTAPTGWTIYTSVDDAVVYTTKGSSAGGGTGGEIKASSTWTQPNHTHTGPSHTHTTASHILTTAEMPVHSHAPIPHSHTALSGYGSFLTSSGGSGSFSGGGTGGNSPTTAVANASVAVAGSGAAHEHGATGADGTAATGNSATANTWRPLGYNFIICTKN